MQQEMVHQDLRTKSISKLFMSYLIPAVLGMVLMSVNIIIDGIMVSRGVGALGLAGVNVASPVFPIIFAISLWIGMGGATLYSIALGENKVKHAQHIFTQSITLAVVIVTIIMFVFSWNIEGLAYLFGANDVILPYTIEYLEVLLMFGIVYVLENILSIFIRNDGNPKLAMAGLITTAVLNIVFNYIFIFIFNWGVKGSAYGTIVSAAIGLLVLLTHFFRKKSILKFTKLKFDWLVVKEIMTIGFPSFMTEMSAAIVTVGYNVTFIKYAGETGVAAFAIVNYIHTMALLMFFGIGAALQPIVSYHFGAELLDRLKAALRLAIKTALICGALAIVIGFIGAKYIVMMFDIKTQELLTFTIKGIGLFFIQYIFLGFNIVYAEYFQSIRQTKRSTFIILSRGLLLVFPLLWIMPNLFGVNGIWLVPVTAEAITMVVIIIMNRRKDPLLVPKHA
ncbi:MATE family efflux transporter [Paenibacillus sp. N1-5-1-14]|uniref:MATE family efflux transporter n=1 Tax=Paenibacillus radicibacter TaxID=2972488 RepID=UPI002158B745|nr:MATE family efflux transporter [Paenibacillus radicibacter]MCR8644680.1 MATE family efflux transporter [Paenibacillus radicibacter]